MFIQVFGSRIACYLQYFCSCCGYWGHTTTIFLQHLTYSGVVEHYHYDYFPHLLVFLLVTLHPVWRTWARLANYPQVKDCSSSWLYTFWSCLPQSLRIRALGGKLFSSWVSGLSYECLWKFTLCPTTPSCVMSESRCGENDLRAMCPSSCPLSWTQHGRFLRPT